MISTDAFEKELLHFLKENNDSVDIFFIDLPKIDSMGLYTTEKNNASTRLRDLGPNKPIVFKFSESTQKTHEIVVRVMLNILENNLEEINKFRFLLLSSIVEDYMHEKILQNSFYKKISKSDTISLSTQLIGIFNSVDWKQNFDIITNPTSLEDWENVFRSFSYLFHSSNLIDVLACAVKNYEKFNSPPLPNLTSLLKARLLFDIPLNTYLSVFEETDVNFISAFIFSNFVPPFPENSKAVSIFKMNLSSFVSDKSNFEKLVLDLLTDHQFEYFEKNFTRNEIVQLISSEVANGISNKSFFPTLPLAKFTIYPRLLKIFEDKKIDIAEQDVSNHIALIYMNSLSTTIKYADKTVIYSFPHHLIANNTQESYSYIYHSLMTCSSEVFESYLKKLKGYCYFILPHFFGRHFSENFALKATTNLYLISLSSTWLTVVNEEWQGRSDKIMDIINSSLLEPFINKIAKSTKDFSVERHTNFVDEAQSFFLMMIEAKKQNKFHIFSSIANATSNIAPINWPWLDQTIIEKV